MREEELIIDDLRNVRILGSIAKDTEKFWNYCEALIFLSCVYLLTPRQQASIDNMYKLLESA